MPVTMDCVVVGDAAVGKSCMLSAYADKTFLDTYTPTVFNHYTVTASAMGRPVTLTLCDLPGLKDYDQLRSLCYFKSTAVCLVCYSVVEVTALESVTNRWVPEVKAHCPKVPFLLVGTQTDLRTNPENIRLLAENGKSPSTNDDGVALAQELGAVRYVECSALTAEGLTTVFDEAVVAALQHTSAQRSRKCIIL